MSLFLSNGIIVGKNKRGTGIKSLGGRLKLPRIPCPYPLWALGSGGGEGKGRGRAGLIKLMSNKALVGYILGLWEEGHGPGALWHSDLAASPFPSLSWL